MAFEAIHRGRATLLAHLSVESELLLDEVAALGIITEEEYEALETCAEPREKVRRLLVKVQRKGEDSCQQFLDCLQSLFPDLPPDLWPPQPGSSHHRDKSQDLAGASSSEEGQPQHPEGALPGVRNDLEKPEDALPMGDTPLEDPENVLTSKRRDLEEAGSDLPLERNESDHPKGASPRNGHALKTEVLVRKHRQEKSEEKSQEAASEGMLSIEKNDIGKPVGPFPMKVDTEDQKVTMKPHLEAPEGAVSSGMRGDAGPWETGDDEAGGQAAMSPGSDVSRRAETSGDDASMEGTESETSEASSAKLNAGRRRALKRVLSMLRLKKLKKQKLQLNDILEITAESLKDWTPHRLEDLPWHFLRNIMALNGTARNTSLARDPSEDDTSEDEEGDMEGIFSLLDSTTGDSLHPLDVLCAVLHCSDSFLQQEILSKMAMCQFALPLLLPPLDTPKCTLLLWAMRGIVKKWRPHSLAKSRGFREESLVLAQMPVISFVRLGPCSLSKSKLLNEVLSPTQQHHDFFVHRDMESGNIPRVIADGLVEISWYFPQGRENSDLFPEPVAVMNLRGDIKSHWPQFSFLTEVSSTVFMLMESIDESQYELLSSLHGSATKYYFVLNNEGGKAKQMLGFLNKLAPALKMTKAQLLVKEKGTNSAELGKKLGGTLSRIMDSFQKITSIQSLALTARELGIQVDEDGYECRRAMESVDEITVEIRDVAEYKREMLKLQGELWKNLAKVEKELCRMKGQRDVPPEDYRARLRGEQVKLREQQNQCDLTGGMVKFINVIGQLPPVEKHHFLRWLKFRLDGIARGNLSGLRAKYKEKCRTSGIDARELAELDELISASSLGVEHFMRELGQFYEAECTMVKEGNMQPAQRQFIHLPGIAADLMLEGFPMELIDGDASNIPLQWVTDVLNQLQAKVGGKSRMLVLTVLGVQSTGKSTLLNTMFGLQFAVSSGRCTRGAFMSLIKVAESFRQELGCDFILVIDTEGLKAPELAKLEDSFEHDNELATLVIGLSDITIVNMAMENATEMKDILQIVVHAFLRMGEIGIKPNCQFVHQNVSDVSAHDQNMRDRKHLLEQLNEMTKAAARMENQCREMKFSDIMDYDPEKHNWYIPGLWHGVPPMAPVNMGYSESVYELKKYLFEYLRCHSHPGHLKDIPQFIQWVASLWNAVKHENFIFSFRNSLVAEAYNHLSVHYAKWEWGFRKEVHLWVSKAETAIQNQSLDNHSPDTLEKLRLEGYQLLYEGEQRTLESLQGYFESGTEGLHLIEKYREDFLQSAKFLRLELERYSMQKYEEAIHIQRGRSRIDLLQASYMKTIEGKVDKLLRACQEREGELTPKELEEEFKRMWRTTLSELPLEGLRPCHVLEDMYFQLQRDLQNKGSMVNQMLHKVQTLLTYQGQLFQMKKEHLDLSFIKAMCEVFTHDCWHRAEDFSKALMDECRDYVRQKVQAQGDYDENYCSELLWIINSRLQEEDIRKLKTTLSFEVDLKLHILGEAAGAFQKMHEDFIKKNDPQHRLEKLRPQYFSTFRDLYYEKDACRKKAIDFCNQCLRPALEEYVRKRLGIEIVDDFLSSGQSLEYSSRSFFQFTVQKKLLEEMNFDNYVKYISDYEGFVKTWIWIQLVNRYQMSDALGELQRDILDGIIKKVQEALQSSEHRAPQTISQFLDRFCQVLDKELVLSKDSLDVILFKNTATVGQFSGDIQMFLPQVEESLLSMWEGVRVDGTLSRLHFKPQDEIFKRVFGCGKQCPFCKVPCEAGGNDHKEHFASVHRPKGLGRYRFETTSCLVYSLCSSDVVSTTSFKNWDTNYEWHPYQAYREVYPDWRIQPDPSIAASDYWKFIFATFNRRFAKEYSANPADLPKEWLKITKGQAMDSIQEAFNMQ
ncbi:interferon-induced very large GTPase 1 isoform X2 [Alligator mississippiensis]|uniref:Interferon-induced very large GTPase 1-like n=1 Tax=Alligator mississippiensis TaxID=8496 RepID=A0A151MVS0_ALLMI|nr:interferon-induced very large GTPase 1 isoform X2 [Alligator mississippiensis]KYO28641.1 hypothetical protein Y1Q_0000807 [Alligator mississippiensis]